jgi:hypothetical protein
VPADDAGLERQTQADMEYVRGVEAAIAALHTFSGYVHFARIEQHIRKQCLDKAQTAQPEGERA